RTDNQLPTRMPFDFTVLTRLMLAASSGARSPLSTASPASLRMADMRMMIDDDPRPRLSRDARHALTVALLNPGRGASRNQSRNSFSAMLYTRRVIGEETLSRTNFLRKFHSAAFSAKTKWFILGPFIGHYRQLCHVDITSVPQ